MPFDARSADNTDEEDDDLTGNDRNPDNTDEEGDDLTGNDRNPDNTDEEGDDLTSNDRNPDNTDEEGDDLTSIDRFFAARKLMAHATIRGVDGVWLSSGTLLATGWDAGEGAEDVLLKVLSGLVVPAGPRPRCPAAAGVDPPRQVHQQQLA